MLEITEGMFLNLLERRSSVRRGKVGRARSGRSVS